MTSNSTRTIQTSEVLTWRRPKKMNATKGRTSEIFAHSQRPKTDTKPMRDNLISFRLIASRDRPKRCKKSSVLEPDTSAVHRATIDTPRRVTGRPKYGPNRSLRQSFIQMVWRVAALMLLLLVAGKYQSQHFSAGQGDDRALS